MSKQIARILMAVLVSSITASGKVIYVDADAPGPFHTGSIWTYAYKHIQNALSEANASAKPVVIHVAQGIYRPDETATTPSGTGDRYTTFQLINGVILKGGYAGNGQPDPDIRDFTIYETILSGDLSGNDVPVADPCDLSTEPTRVENSLHVVTGSGCDETAVLDGFTVIGGNANQSIFPHYLGGGMYSEYGSPTIIVCKFIRNSASWVGGGMENWDGCRPNLVNCLFSENRAGDWGGGMHNEQSSPTLSKCVFNSNSAGIGAAGVNNSYSSSPKLTNCTFSENLTPGRGGGMYNYENSNPTLTNCNFIGNSATDGGGGIHNHVSSPTLTNCKLIGNLAGWGGGGIRNEYNSKPILTNCLFSENQAGHWGGGMLNIESSNSILTNCTFSRNVAIYHGGGGLSNFTGSNPILMNCIVWGNTAAYIPQIHKDDTCFVTITYSDIQGGWLGTGNINTDPYFADPVGGDFHLKSEAGKWDPASESWVVDIVTSPCVDAGDLTSDWRGELWPHGCLINMGAYGGTPEASMSLLDPGSIADINVDGQIGGKDTKLLIDKWLFEEVLLPEDLNRDGKVNFADYAIFAYFRGLPSPATNPNPNDGAMFVSVTADFTWIAGSYTTSHDVYFGTNNPPPFIGNQSSTMYDPGEMNYSTTYYWRIDEIGDAGRTNGLVWSFTTLSSPPPPPP